MREPATAAALGELLPEAEVVGFWRSGHWAFLEEPERFQEVVTDFFSLTEARRHGGIPEVYDGREDRHYTVEGPCVPRNDDLVTL